MPGEPLLLGPFVGGLNSASDPSAVADSELVDEVNFELDLDGSLLSRPPIVKVDAAGLSIDGPVYALGSAVFDSGNYILGSTTVGTQAFNGSTWSALLPNSPSANGMAQYKDKVWLIADPVLPGIASGNWDPAAGFATVAGMPKGGPCVVFKERLFVVAGDTATTNSSRLYYSEPGDFTNWPPANNIDVSPGDGQKLIDLAVYNDNLVLFKQDSTFVLAYDTKPADAVLRNISETIGCSTRGCQVEYENSIFLYHEGDVYEMVNYDFAKINVKAKFAFDNTTPSPRKYTVGLSLLGDRLIVRYFNRIYVYTLRTRMWSRWESSHPNLHNFGRLIKYPTNDFADINDAYYGGSILNADPDSYRILDGWDSTTKEQYDLVTPDITCSILTKNYDLAVAHQFKRLFWWGADVLTARDVTGIATPIVVGGQTLWGDIDLIKTWDSLGTWANPLGALPYVTTIIPNSQGAFSIHVKFLRSLRFRKINFQIILLTDGTSVQGPCKIFTITIHVATKEVVPKMVN